MRRRESGEICINEELRDLYSSASIIRIIKSSRRMRLAGHVARMGGGGEREEEHL
jgi:hypothetical protein